MEFSGPIQSVRNFGGSHRGPMGGPMGGPMLESQKLGGSNLRIPKVGGVRTPPTRAVAAPMRRMDTEYSSVALQNCRISNSSPSTKS